MSDEKIDKILDEIGNIKITLVKLDINMDEHMRRCDLLEKRDDRIEARIVPLEEEKQRQSGAMKLATKLIGLILTILAVIAAFWQALRTK